MFTSCLECAKLWAGPWGLGGSRVSALRKLERSVAGRESSKRAVLTECDGAVKGKAKVL